MLEGVVVFVLVVVLVDVEVLLAVVDAVQSRAARTPTVLAP